ncbi:alpha/beta hydrolase [Streptomyces sp. NPDC005538]|uniref:alpha/beta hydrolase family protein n=1 Tax=unclassified Streptomyces TaxID=2593676 RepID=UPI0033A91883
MEHNATLIRLAHGVPGALYRPRAEARAGVAVLVMHSDADYLSFSAGDELSARGYHVLCANVADKNAGLDRKLVDVSHAIRFLRSFPGIEKIILLGHSGGGTLLSAYQNLAENGAKAFAGPEKLVQCSATLDGLPPADGLMLLDSNWGNGAMRLLSLDPAIVSEDGGVRIDASLDLFNPANGFSPDGSTYPDEFIRAFQREQGARNNRLIDEASRRLRMIESGAGRYADDEPFIVPGAAHGFRNNKLYPQDTRLMSRSRKARDLLRADGSLSREVIRCVRPPQNDRSYTASYHSGALATTVRTFLDSYAVRTTDAYGYDESSLYGVDWSSSYNTAVGNVRGITAPLLVMGMTAGWEFAAAETIFESATSEDRTLAFVEGANHQFKPMTALEDHPGQFGDTMRTTYDFVDRWIQGRPGISA